MNDFILSCSSSADLDAETYGARRIEVLPMHFMLSGKEMLDDGYSLSHEDFYKAMQDGADTKTTQLNIDDFLNYFENLLQKNKKIVHVELSSGLSGTVNNAKNAAEELMKKYPDTKIFVVDSLGASAGMGLLTCKLADLRDEGKTAEEVFAFAEEHKLEVHHWFFSSDLTFYVKGGRISKASGWFGTLLHICPLLNMSFDGKLVPRFKIIGKKKVVKSIASKMSELCQNGSDYAEECFISQSACKEDAYAVKELCEEMIPSLKGKVRVYDIGSLIGSHTGPGTVALFFWGNKRVD